MERCSDGPVMRDIPHVGFFESIATPIDTLRNRALARCGVGVAPLGTYPDPLQVSIRLAVARCGRWDREGAASLVIWWR